jgi:hypothetical protein
MNICQYCNKEFEAKRSDAKVCSDRCQKALSRTAKSDNVGDKSDKIISDTPSEIKSDKPVIIEPSVFINHITGEKHDSNEISKRTGLSYDLSEVSAIAKFKKYRCTGCGEPTWFGCAECGKNGGQYAN